MLTMDLTPYLLTPGGDAEFQWSDSGFYAPRNALSPGGFAEVVRALSCDRDVVVTDFNLPGLVELQHNYHDGCAFQREYGGVLQPGGTILFHVDHHYVVPALNHLSATPLMQRWLLGLHEAGHHAILERVAGASYVANHEDQDILYAITLARMATDQAYLQGVGRLFAQAALVNDHVVLSDDPAVNDAFLAGLAVERMIQNREVTFEEAQRRVIPSVAMWLQSGSDRSASPQVAAWVAHEAQVLDEEVGRFARWEAEGLLHVERGVAWMEPPDHSENAYFMRYLQRTKRSDIRLQVLCNPEPHGRGGMTFKVRSHDDSLELAELFQMLTQRLSGPPGFHFGGRHSAGGSRPAAPLSTQEVLEVVFAYLDTN